MYIRISYFTKASVKHIILFFSKSALYRLKSKNSVELIIFTVSYSRKPYEANPKRSWRPSNRPGAALCKISYRIKTVTVL